MSSYSLSPLQLSLIGAGIMLNTKGAVEITEGNLLGGSEYAILGITTTNIAMNTSPESIQQETLKTSMLATSLITTCHGWINFLKGNIKKGMTQIAGGIGSAAVFSSLSNQVTALLSQAASLASLSGCITSSGIKEIRNGDYLNGIKKTALGVMGLAAAGYYGYQELTKLSSAPPGLRENFAEAASIGVTAAATALTASALFRKPPCESLGQSNLCWHSTLLDEGVSHYTFEGDHAHLPQKMQILKVDPNKAELRVQDARKVFYQNEKPSTNRLPLLDIASRVPDTIAAINGGYFHYVPPVGEYYIWNGAPYSNGDPIGEVIVDGIKTSENPSDPHWTSLRVSKSGQVSISNKLEENILHALGGAPILIQEGQLIKEFGHRLPFLQKQIATPGDFRYHMDASHGRTAVCETESNQFLLVTAEGRMQGAVGFRMKEFAQFLKDLGCKNAFNLDGGGSVDLVTLNPHGKFSSTVRALDPNGKRPLATAVLVQSHPYLRAERRLQEEVTRGEQLLQKTMHTLKNGGKIIYKKSNSGLYFIQNSLGQTLAIFKPTDERNFGPNNRDPRKQQAEPTEEDIEFRQLDSVFQGKPAQRQYLATLLNPHFPAGTTAEMESELFVNPMGSGPIRKSGFLQEWVSDAEPLPHGHPAGVEFFQKIKPQNAKATFPVSAASFDTNPLLDQIPLDEFQQVSIANILLYNQDGHAGNYLIKRDSQKNPHLISVDMESTLPWNLNGLLGFSNHPRANEPFTKASLDFIAQLEPNYVRALVEKLELPKQAAVNIQALATVIRRFSAANLNLAQLHQFVANPPQTPSSLSRLMEQSKLLAILQLSLKDQNMYHQAKSLRKDLWEGKNIPEDAREELNKYKLHEEKRIEKAIERHFWKEFNEQITTILNSYSR